MSVGDVAGLVAAIAFGVLVLLAARPLWKLGSLIGSVEKDVVIKQVVPLLGQTQTTVEHVNTNLANAETLTTNAADITTNARALATAFSATLGGPLVKAAAFSYAVRRAVGKRDKAEVDAEVRSARKAAKKAVKDRKSGS
jgi:uncharacterized protein YoxC